MAFQNQYDVNPQIGYVGAIARDKEPYAIDLLPVQVPSGGRNPRPGDAVYWDSTNNGAAVPTTAALSEQVFGIVTYYEGVVAGSLSSTPSGANSPQFIEYADGQNMPVVVMGTVWTLAGGAIEYSNLVRWNITNFDFEALTTPASFADMLWRPIECVSIVVADTNIFESRIGFGRAL